VDRRLPLLAALLASLGCALFGPRPGPPPDAPTESSLSAVKPPDVCKVSPSALRRIGSLEAGNTTYGEVVERLGRPRADAPGDRSCWLVSGADGGAIYAHGRVPDQPIRSLALSAADEESNRSCTPTSAIAPPLALEAGLRLGMAAADVERILGPVVVDEGGAFGKECCGLEQTGEGERGPVYGFGCSAVLGAFKDGKLASLLVSRYEPPATSNDR
jgi:hypothetical protein